MYFKTAQKITLFFFTSLPTVLPTQHFHVKKKNQLYFYLPPSRPYKIEESGNQYIN